MKAGVGEEGNLVLDSEWDREPVKSLQDGGVTAAVLIRILTALC